MRTASSTLSGVAIDKTGLGTLVLNGSSGLSGSTVVDSGTLVVNDTLAGTMTVNSGGTLMGMGTVGGDTTINAGGTVYPGTVGAPLTISGNFTQNSGSSYTAEVSATGSDKIVVNGSATIHTGSTFNIVLDPGTYTTGTHYVVMTASGGITGSYSTTILPSPGTNQYFSLEYDPDDIQLIINSSYVPPDPPSWHFVNYAQTYNQMQVATALDTIGPTATGNMATYLTALEGFSPSGVQQALNQLSGDIYPSISSIELQTTTAWVQLVTNRVANQMQLATLAEEGLVAAPGNDDAEIYTVSFNEPAIRSGSFDQPITLYGESKPLSASSAGPPLVYFRPRYRPKWTGWTQGYGLGGSLGSSGNAGALSYGLGGTVFGIDRWIGRNTMFGLMGGYAGSNVGDSSSVASSGINGYQVGVYGLHRFERCYAIGATAYSGDNYTTNRDVSVPGMPLTAHSSYAGNQFVKYAELGTTIGRGRTSFQPLTAIQYIYLNQQGFSESGAGVVDLNTGSQITNSVRGMLGARVFHEYHWGKRRWVPMLQARWQHEWGDGTRLVTSSFSGAPTVAFNTAGNTLGRDFGMFTAGSNLIVSPRTSIYAAYDLQTASRYTANMGSAGLQYRW
jgi:autotransporter-associated beta strand protein